MVRPTDPLDLRTLIRMGTYLICWTISEIPRFSHATPEQHSLRYSVHAGTLQSASGIFCIFSSKHGPVLSPASRVANHGSMVWLRTGVSSGNRPMFVLKR